MTFYPENKFPKEGFPVYDGKGDQRKISDTRYHSKYDLENTEKAQVSSTNDIFSTKEGALGRAEQLGCEGYRELMYGNKKVYAPCNEESNYNIVQDQFLSPINFKYIGSYRILSWDKSFIGVKKIKGWKIDLSLSINNNGKILNYDDIVIEFRYSIDGKSWSLWTNKGSVIEIWENNDLEKVEYKLDEEIELDPNNNFYPQFRFTSKLKTEDGLIIFNESSPLDPTINITNIELDLEFDEEILNGENKIISKPSFICGDEKNTNPVSFFNKNFSFDPYAVNQGINLYKDLSKMVNEVFGFEVNYYSVQPQARGRDVILKEYTLFNVVDEKCIKIVVPDNRFPDSKVNFDPFGITFEEPFEIQIDKNYFEEIFGKNSQPRKRDIIYFPLTNRIYEINSTYLFRDFMYSPVYFKIELRKYEPKSNTYFKDIAHKEELEGISLSAIEMFKEETTLEEEKRLKPTQYHTTSQRRSEDPYRDYIFKDLSIIGYDLNNNWTIVFNNYYDLASSFIDNSEYNYFPNKYREAIRYKKSPVLYGDGEFSFTCWFNIRNYYSGHGTNVGAFIPLPVEGASGPYEPNTIKYTTKPYRHGLSKYLNFNSNPEGYVSIKGDSERSGGFKVIDVIDEYTFVVENHNETQPIDFNRWRMQKAQARNLLDGLYENNLGEIEGIRFDIIHSGVIDPGSTNYINSGSISIILNGEEINSPLQFEPEADKWYGIAINISNRYKQLSIHIYDMMYDETNPQYQTSELKALHEEILTLKNIVYFDIPEEMEEDIYSPFYNTNKNGFKVFTSPLYVTNLRVFKNIIDIEEQSTILNQNIIRDEHLAHIIDNAKPPIGLRKFARNR